METEPKKKNSLAVVIVGWILVVVITLLFGWQGTVAFMVGFIYAGVGMVINAKRKGLRFVR